MTAKLKRPVAFAVIGLLVSVALGVTLVWRAATPVIRELLVKRAKPLDHERKSKGWDFWTIEIENLSNELKEERVRLKQRTELLEQREARVALEEKELAKVRTSIETMRREIAEKVVEISTDEAKNLRALAQTYTNLSPKAVVAIIREMDDATSVKILSLMKPDAVGPVFEEMSRTTGPDGPLSRRAAILSEKLRLVKAAKASS
jgi:flagellar motility protein MotE (MotC chaperone)